VACVATAVTAVVDSSGLEDVTVVTIVDAIGAASEVTAELAETNGEAVVDDVTAVIGDPALMIKPLSAPLANSESTSISCIIVTVTSAFTPAAELEICAGGPGGRVPAPLTTNKLTMTKLSASNKHFG